MLNSNFNLYKAEWLDLVFADRNKEYGAYYIRQHYAGNMIKAMGITFSGIAVLSIMAATVLKPKPVEVFKIVETRVLPYIPPIPPKVEPPKEQALPAKPAAPVNTTRFVPPVVTEDSKAEEPPTIVQLENTAVGPVEIKGAGTTGTTIPDDAGTGTGAGVAAAPTIDETIHYGADVMPEPIGGAEAWAKFLQKNLRFPTAALEHNIGGRVLVTFVVEKDGHLSSLSIDRGAGFGMDEEALRVLKLAKAWKPGMQKGQPVRVKYTLPINFSITE